MRRQLVLGVKNTQNRTAQRPREKGPLVRGRELPTSLASHEPLSFLWAFFLHFSFLWVISVVIYPYLLFIILLHLSVIHAHIRVHVPSTIPSDALWAAVAPIALSKGHIHINGVRVLVVGI